MIISETKFCTYLDNLDKFLFAKYDVESRVRFVWLRSLSKADAVYLLDCLPSTRNGVTPANHLSTHAKNDKQSHRCRPVC